MKPAQNASKSVLRMVLSILSWQVGFRQNQAALSGRPCKLPKI